MSSSPDIAWIGSATGSASFNTKAAAAGIRGTAGVIGTPGAVGRDQTGSFRLLGLFREGLINSQFRSIGVKNTGNLIDRRLKF